MLHAYAVLAGVATSADCWSRREYHAIHYHLILLQGDWYFGAFLISRFTKPSIGPALVRLILLICAQDRHTQCRVASPTHVSVNDNFGSQ